jgi:hypothetical protein
MVSGMFERLCAREGKLARAVMLGLNLCYRSAPSDLFRKIGRPIESGLTTLAGYESAECRNTGRHHLGMPGRLRRNPQCHFRTSD